MTAKRKQPIPKLDATAPLEPAPGPEWSDRVRALEAEAVKLGTVRQRQAYAAGELDEQELLQLARSELYRPFSVVSRWRQIVPSELIHRRGCAGPDDPDGGVDFTASLVMPEDMDEDDLATFMRLRHLATSLEVHPWIVAGDTTIASTPVQIIAFDHTGQCRRCGSACSASSARVIIPWAGRNLVREYAL